MAPSPAYVSAASVREELGLCSGCRQMSGRWPPNAISCDELGEDEFLGVREKGPWLRTDLTPPPAFCLHLGQLSFCTQASGQPVRGLSMPHGAQASIAPLTGTLELTPDSSPASWSRPLGNSRDRLHLDSGLCPYVPIKPSSSGLCPPITTSPWLCPPYPTLYPSPCHSGLPWAPLTASAFLFSCSFWSAPACTACIPAPPSPGLLGLLLRVSQSRTLGPVCQLSHWLPFQA